MNTDPVCGMAVVPDEAAGQSSYEGKDYYFCSTNCKNKFDSDPVSFVHPQKKAATTPKLETTPKTKPAGKTARVTLPLEGMSCASCVNTIEGALNGTAGVVKATVNFASEKATVEYDPTLLGRRELAQAVEASGYRVADTREKVTLQIGGMTCASCVQRIEKALSGAEGVFDATVNLATEQAHIEFDAGMTGPAKLTKVVEGTGYSVVQEVGKEKEGEKADDDLSKVEKAKKLLVYAAVPETIIMGLMMIHYMMAEIPYYNLIVALLGFPIVFIFGWPTHQSSWRALRHRHANMDVLISMGSIPPFLMGLAVFFFPAASFMEMATTIVTFHLIGRYLEVRAKGRASQAIKKLLELGAKTARIVVDGEEREIPVEQVKTGDIMLVRPGEKVPTDGLIIEGKSAIDESMATGESMPVQKKAGDKAIGATINQNGLLKVKATKVGKDTFLSQVIKMVEECQGSKVPIQEFADRITAYMVPTVLAVAVSTVVLWLVFPDFFMAIIQWGEPFLPWINTELGIVTLAIYSGIAVLVISCPCALGLGTPHGPDGRQRHGRGERCVDSER